MILIIPATGWSKGETTKIVIEGDNLSSPVEITSTDIVGQFNIWNGPGVSTRGPDGVPHPPAYLDQTRSAGADGYGRVTPAGKNDSSKQQPPCDVSDTMRDAMFR